jgi:hypothetical protein
LYLVVLAVAAADTRQFDAPPVPFFTTAGRPTALDAAEESSSAAAEVARRFNPAMALPTRTVWPVDVRYTWGDGADLKASVIGASGKVVRSYVAVPHAELERRAWDDLPTRDSHGHRIKYSVDAPGDDHMEHGQSRWVTRFDALTGQAGAKSSDDALTASPFPPTQYVHLFWYNRDEGLLGIQYWFFYPFNEWINHHEGDWEHINVIVRGPRTLAAGTAQAFSAVGYQYFFHGWRHDTDQVVRIEGGSAEGGTGDHVVVFSGGRGRFLWWGGTQSGASYPLPGVYAGAGPGPFGPSEDTRSSARFIAAQDFRLVMLPEPERLDAQAHPELSWLRLPFFVGQAAVATNPPPLNWLGLGGPPSQPAQRTAWNARGSKPLWRARLAGALDLRQLPVKWTLLSIPGQGRISGPLATGE